MSRPSPEWRYDGVEGGPAAFRVDCPTCAAGIEVELWSLLARARSDGVDPAGLVPVDVLGSRLHRTPSGLLAYRVTVSCGCGATVALVVGCSEFQPGRYLAELHAVRAGG